MSAEETATLCRKCRVGSGLGLEPKKLQALALVLAALPFKASMASGRYHYEFGKLTEFTYSDPAAIVLGVAAVICGVLLIVNWSRTPSASIKAFVIAVTVTLVGAWHVSKGAGYTASPPAWTGADSESGSFEGNSIQRHALNY
jgi:hypothetical protein